MLNFETSTRHQIYFNVNYFDQLLFQLSSSSVPLFLPDEKTMFGRTFYICENLFYPLSLFTVEVFLPNGEFTQEFAAVGVF